MKIRIFFFKNDRVSSNFQLMLIKAYLDQLKEMLTTHEINTQRFFKLDEVSIYLGNFKPTADVDLFTFHHVSDPLIFGHKNDDESNDFLYTSCKGEINKDEITFLNGLENCEHDADCGQCETPNQCFIATTRENLQAATDTICYEVALEYAEELSSNFTLRFLNTPAMQRFNETVDKEVSRLSDEGRLSKAQRLNDAKYRALQAAECCDTLFISFSKLYKYSDNHQESVKQVAVERKNPLTDGAIKPLKQAAGSLLNSINFWKKEPSTAELMVGGHVPDAKIEFNHRTLTAYNLKSVKNKIKLEEKVNRQWILSGIRK